LNALIAQVLSFPVQTGEKRKKGCDFFIFSLVTQYMSYEKELATIKESLFVLEHYCREMNLKTVDLDVLSEEADEIDGNLGTEIGALAQHNSILRKSLEAGKKEDADIELMNMLLTLQNIRGEFDNCINYIEAFIKERPIDLNNDS